MEYNNGIPFGERAGKEPDEYVQSIIDKNEEEYGEEIREKYGNAATVVSSRILSRLSKEEYEELMDEQVAIYERLGSLFGQGYRPMHEKVQDAVAEHHKFMAHFGNFYTPDVYKQLGEMYLEDKRFIDFFNQFYKGMTPWLTDAIAIYADNLTALEAKEADEESAEETEEDK